MDCKACHSCPAPTRLHKRPILFRISLLFTVHLPFDTLAQQFHVLYQVVYASWRSRSTMIMHIMVSIKYRSHTISPCCLRARTNTGHFSISRYVLIQIVAVQCPIFINSSWHLKQGVWYRIISRAIPSTVYFFVTHSVINYTSAWIKARNYYLHFEKYIINCVWMIVTVTRSSASFGFTHLLNMWYSLN